MSKILKNACDMVRKWSAEDIEKNKRELADSLRCYADEDDGFENMVFEIGLKRLVKELKKTEEQIQKKKAHFLYPSNQWLVENEDTFRWIDDFYGYSREEIERIILEKIRKKYFVDSYEILYKYKVGHTAENVMEVVAYFDELREIADEEIALFIEHGLKKI